MHLLLVLSLFLNVIKSIERDVIKIKNRFTNYCYCNHRDEGMIIAVICNDIIRNLVPTKVENVEYLYILLNCM